MPVNVAERTLENTGYASFDCGKLSEMAPAVHSRPRIRVWRKGADVATPPKDMATRRARSLAIGLCCVGLLVSGCGDKRNDATNFCRQLEQELPGLSARLTSQSEIDQMVARYRRLGEVAPLAVAEDWDALTSLMADAAKVNPNDQTEMETFAEEALVANSASQRALRWVLNTCGVDLSGSRPASQ
jgi:hypothetical protein